MNACVQSHNTKNEGDGDLKYVDKEQYSFFPIPLWPFGFDGKPFLPLGGINPLDIQVDPEHATESESEPASK